MLALGLLLLATAGELELAATRELPDAGDVALVQDLVSGALILEHHPAASRASIAPGSVMKAFTAYALIEAKLAGIEHVCAGSHTDAGGVTRSCWDRRGHGAMRLRTALAMSCNVWFYRAVEALDPLALAAAWRGFGLEIGAGTSKLDVALGDDRALELTARSLLEATSRLASRDPRLEGGHLELIARGLEEAAESGTLAETFAGLDVAAKSGTGPRRGGKGTLGVVIGWLPTAKPRYAFVIVKERGRGARDAGPAARAIAKALTK